MRDSSTKPNASEAKSDPTESTFDVVPESAQQQQDEAIAEYIANRASSSAEQSPSPKTSNSSPTNSDKKFSAS